MESSQLENGDFVGHIYHIELEISDSTDIAWSASYIDILLNIDNCDCLKTKDWGWNMSVLFTK
jgi:hypothetical protein